MTVTANTILTRVRSQLIDELATKRWSDAELLRWLSDGQRTIVAMVPSLGEITATQLLVPGTKQVLPNGSIMLLNVQRNMGLDGLTPGRAVTITSQENLDRVDPDWHASRRSDVVMHYVYDVRRPLVFYVYPPSTGFTHLELSRSQTPPDFTDLADLMTIEDLYQTALFDYVMFRAHQKDSDYAAGEGKAGVYLQLFQMFITGVEAAGTDASPNRQVGVPDAGPGAPT